ncbi:MAG TPA: RdgB/HAM1 family non-canonical purine NTP pyrophosphatase [Pirellulales bacterium]|jgi:XTP/dITP diphosphohydrolase
MPTLVLGTHNRKKGIELAELVAPLGVTARTLAEYPQALTVVEDGDTFAANARLKAIQQARHLNEWVLGEDSGLCVAVLGGAPGVYSARYSGDNATDEANNDKLLAELDATPLEKRGAYYVCYAVLANPQGEIAAEVTGECHGRILFEGRGSAGFGYDPLFEIVEYHRTFGELGAAVKRCLSHRARALREMLPRLAALLG